MQIFSQSSQKFLSFNPGRRISAYDALSHAYFQSLDSTSKSLYAQPFPSKKPSLEERAAWKTFLIFIDSLAQAPFWTCLPSPHYMLLLGLVEVLPQFLVDAFSLQQVTSISLPATLFTKKKQKKNIKSCFPACLSSLAGSPSAQRKLHCQISDTEAATPCCQGSLCLDECHKNITART